MLPNCLHDLILGQPFCRLFSGINFTYNGSGPALDLLNSKVNRHAFCLAQARVKAPKLFLGLNGNERPIRSPPRKYSPEERNFIEAETKHLLQQGIVHPSGSPWCSQVVVARGDPSGAFV